MRRKKVFAINCLELRAYVYASSMAESTEQSSNYKIITCVSLSMCACAGK